MAEISTIAPVAETEAADIPNPHDLMKRNPLDIARWPIGVPA